MKGFDIYFGNLNSMSPKKFYIKRNKNKVYFTETGRTVIKANTKQCGGF